VYEIDGVVLVVDPHAFVHPTAVLIRDVLIRDVVIDPGCYIGPGASLRGDMGVVVGERAFAGAHSFVPSVTRNVRWDRPPASRVNATGSAGSARGGRGRQAGIQPKDVSKRLVGHCSVRAQRREPCYAEGGGGP
jgi:hypothetical protein